VSFLRKQESRLLCACSCGLDGQSRTLEYFLDSRLRGNDTLGLARQENGRLLHSAKRLPLSFLPVLPLAALPFALQVCCILRCGGNRKRKYI